MFIKYNLIYYAIACLLMVLAILEHPVFLLGLVIYSIFIVYQKGWKMLVYIIVFTVIFTFALKYPQSTDERIIQGKIINKDEDSIVLKTNTTKVKVYGELIGYEIGDELEIEVSYFDISEATNDNAFDYRNYLYSQGITNNASLTKIINTQKNHSLFNQLQKRISGDSIVDSYASMFILGIKDETISDYYHQLTELSIVHLFALSGLHIHMLKKLIKKPLAFIVPDQVGDFLSLLIIGFYIYLIPFNISFMRAYLVMLLGTIFKKYLNSLDCLSIVFLLMVVMNPYVIYSLSFIFSYFMYLVILLINRHKYLNLLVYLASIPIILSIQYRINVLSLVLGIVLVPLVSLLYQMLWAYLIFGSFFRPVIEIIITALNNIVVFSNDISVFVNFSKPSLLFILSYYFVYFKMILKINVNQRFYREAMLLFSVVTMFYFKPYYQIFGQVVMIDVGQGDCFLIQQPFNRGNILIDTGGLKNKDIATLTLIPYLRSQGIFELDYVLISHDDFDHNGAYDSLAKQIEIKKTVVDWQEEISIGDVEIQMLKTPTSDNTNDNSLVLIASINGLKYLFTGDISSAVEKQLIKDYPDLKIDVLKVSHHGSNTGTSATLLNTYQPKMALISCGKNNRYGHPHEEVITRLNDYGVKVYRSDLMGMVKVVYYDDDNYIFQ